MNILKLNRKPYFIYCLFILSFLIVSCEKDFVDTISPPQQGSLTQQVISPQQVQNKMLDVPTGEAEVNAAKLHENVKVLDETMNSQMISYSDAKIEFVSHESVNSIQVGDVLNSAPSTLAEYGILAKVLGKEVKDGKIILQVEPGEIGDLFAEADFSFNTQRGVTLKRGAKADFGIDLDFGGEISQTTDGDGIDAIKGAAKIAGRLDLKFEFQMKEWRDPRDDVLRTRVNIHLDKDLSNPDLAFTLSHSYEAIIVDDYKLWVIKVPVGGGFIPFTINADIGLEIQCDFATSPGAIGVDLYGDIGFDRTTIGGVGQFADKYDDWNDLAIDHKFDLNLDHLFDFTMQLKMPKLEVRVTPFKKVGDFFNVNPLVIFAEVYHAATLEFNSRTTCLTLSLPRFGIEGGVKGNWKNNEYQVSVSKETDFEDLSWDLYCFRNNSGTASTGTFSFDLAGNVIQDAEESYTIENSSGLHMAEGLHGKEVVFKSMKGRNSNTEDHGLLYSTLPGDEAGRYLTIKSAPDGKYYNSNYKVLGTSSYATEDVVFKLFATDNGRYLIKGANGKFADLLVGVNNPNSHQKFIEFYRTYNEAKTKDDCKFQILMHPHRPGHYFIYKKDKGYLTPKGNNPARLKLVTRSQEQEFIMMDAENVQIGTAIDVFDPSNTENQTVFMQAYGFGGDQSNNFLKYDNGYKLVTGNSSSADYFTIYKNNDGTQSILGSNGKYLDIYSSGGFIALFNSTDRNCGDCKFSIEKVSGTTDWYNIRHPKTNKVLSYRNGGGLKFISGNAGWNERFRIVM